MKMVKSLLLGTAAGLVAMAGAQAADLPVKAKPVQYVKICSLYGAGFYYIPGTDMCLKMGGWMRAEFGQNVNSSLTFGPMVGGRATRTDQNDYAQRTRGYITADARNQTEYGTLRSYINVGVSQDSPNATAFGTLSVNRGFIQWAGFTFGSAQSFFDFYSPAATQYFGYTTQSDTGDTGWRVASYTAQFGNGLSGTIGFEESRRGLVVNTGTQVVTGTTVLAGLTPTAAGNQMGIRYPDVVANLRIDQAWGSAQLMGALHDASGGYYGTTAGTGGPGNTTGYALGAGIKLNAPMIGAGDFFQAQVNYGKGAIAYLAYLQGAAGVLGRTAFTRYSGNSFGYGWLTDGVYTGAAGGSVQLTEAWGVNAAYEHFWNPRWKTSIYGSYLSVNYNDTASLALCGMTGLAVAAASCNSDFSYWAAGTRTQWNVTKDFYMGLDVLYAKLNTASSGVATLASSGAQPGGAYTLKNQDAWSFRFRVHRDFYP
ncbi:MAG: porin [Rhizobiales bacterium]|nr:porin [Hyphomicrobiales bacterium]